MKEPGGGAAELLRAKEEAADAHKALELRCAAAEAQIRTQMGDKAAIVEKLQQELADMFGWKNKYKELHSQALARIEEDKAELFVRHTSALRCMHPCHKRVPCQRESPNREGNPLLPAAQCTHTHTYARAHTHTMHNTPTLP